MKNSFDIMIALTVTLVLLLVFIGIVYLTNNFFVLGWFIFVLSFYTGYSVVIKVNSSLHTSLVSLTNTICGMIIIGGIIQLRGTGLDTNNILSIITIFFSSINIFGGFYMTQKMLNCVPS
jgi:NAD/NADP transhydrogenase alpha subunit